MPARRARDRKIPGGSDATRLQSRDEVMGVTAMFRNVNLPGRVWAKLLASTALAHTADAQSDEAFDLDTIILRGELIDRPLEDTTTSAIVITGEEIEDRGDLEITDIIERTPGLSRALGDNEFVIRGIPERGVAGGDSGATINTVVDGIRVTDFANIRTNIFSTWDLEQVEVLRGPQSTQTGRNALAGAINVRSRDPDFTPEFKFRGLVGNGRTYQGAFAGNIPIIEDTLAFRLSFDRTQTDGFIDNVTFGADDYARASNTTVRASARLDLGPDFSAILKYTFYDQESSNSEQIDEDRFPDERANLLNFYTPNDRKVRGLNLRMSYALSSALSLGSTTTFSTHDFSAVFDIDNGPTPTPPGFFDGEDEIFEQEITLSYQTERLNAVIGAFYTEIDNEDAFITTGLPAFIIDPTADPTSTANIVNSNDGLTKNYAIFGEAEYDISDRLRGIFGFRYDHEEDRSAATTAFTSDDPTVVLPPSATTRTDADFEAFLPKLGLVYELDAERNVGFVVQRGYRAGGASFNAFSGLTTFDPEFTTNYELSFRGTFLDGRLTTNANAFYTDWTDQQVAVPGPTGDPDDTITINAGESRVWGAELDMRAEVSDNLEVFGGLAYVNTEFEDFVFDGEQLAGNEFPYAPEFTASIGSVYNFDNGFYVGGDISFTSSGFTDVQNTSGQTFDDRTLVNLRAGYRTDTWVAFAYIKNALDEDYVIRRTANVPGVEVGDPREFGFGLQARF